MAKVKFKRGNKQFIDNLPIVDGQLIYNTETGETFEDVGGKRIPTGGKPADETLDKNSTNPVQNKPVAEAINQLNESLTTVSPMDYGAVGDGVTDDTSAIQRMLTEKPKGKKCIFDRMYLVTDHLDMPDGTDMEGVGDEAGIIFRPDIAGKNLDFDAVRDDDVIASIVTIKNTNGSVYPSLFSELIHCSFNRMRFINDARRGGFVNGFIVQSAVENCYFSSWNFVFSHMQSMSRFRHNRVVGVREFFAYACTDTSIEHSYINAINGPWHAFSELSPERTPESLERYKHYTEGTTAFLTAVASTVVTGNFFDYFYAVFWGTATAGSAVTDNIFDTCFTAFRAAVTGIVFSGNVFSNCTWKPERWDGQKSTPCDKIVNGKWAFFRSVYENKWFKNVTVCGNDFSELGALFDTSEARYNDLWNVDSAIFTGNQYGNHKTGTTIDLNVEMAVFNEKVFNNCYFDFWDKKEFTDNLPTFDYGINAAHCFYGQIAYLNNVEYRFVRADKKWHKTSTGEEYVPAP